MAQKNEYICPMHPQIRRESRNGEPGQCPICGMNLVPADQADEADPHAGHEHAAHGAAAPGGQPQAAAPEEGATPSQHAPFKLSMNRQQMIGVKLGKVERRPLFKDIRAAGRLAFDPELYTAQNEYLEALRQVDRVKDSPIAEVRQSAKRMLEAAKTRLRILGLSDPQIARLGKDGEREASLLINKAGEDVWIYADVYEMDLPHVRPGLSAEISAGFLGGKKLAGQVVSVDRVINPATRTAKARILVPRARTVLRPESFVDVMIHSPLGEQVVVPFDAVLDTGTEAWVFVTDGKGGFDPRRVTVKLHAGEWVAIDQGLQGGEQIVTSANFLIDSESRLKAVQSAQAAGPHAGHGGGQGDAKPDPHAGH